MVAAREEVIEVRGGVDEDDEDDVGKYEDEKGSTSSAETSPFMSFLPLPPRALVARTPPSRPTDRSLKQTQTPRHG